MTRLLLPIVLTLLFCNALHICAQNNDSAQAMQQINAIKKNADYVYAEATSPTWENAYDNAKSLLAINMEEWIKSCKGVEDVQGVIARAGNNILQVRSQRGKLFRAFLYVKKSDIIVFTDTKDVLVVPIQKEKDSNEMQTAEDEFVSVVTPLPSASVAPIMTYEPTNDEQRMLKVTKSADIENFVKSNSRITSYGKYQTLPSSERCYIFVYNREGGISAYLLHDATGYTDVRTGMADDISKYKGCGAIWFKY